MSQKNNSEVQADYDAYREAMYRKARREGMEETQAKAWAQQEANLQIAMRQRLLEEQQRGKKK